MPQRSRSWDIAASYSIARQSVFIEAASRHAAVCLSGVASGVLANVTNLLAQRSLVCENTWHPLARCRRIPAVCEVSVAAGPTDKADSFGAVSW